ncbi:MAG: hypothetical protein AVDCRST_MAG26-3900, partial [uncultured Chloroflexia bacterium]
EAAAGLVCTDACFSIALSRGGSAGQRRCFDRSTDARRGNMRLLAHTGTQAV